MFNWHLMAYVAAGAAVAGAVAGWTVKDWQCDAAYSKALEKAAKQQKAMQEKVDETSAAYEEERNKADVVATERTNTIREIYRTAPVPSASCAAPTGIVGLLEGAVSSANNAATGEPSSGM